MSPKTPRKGADNATMAMAMLVAYPQVDMLETLSAVYPATESKKMGRMVTTMTE